jgi:hypothetical protein
LKIIIIVTDSQVYVQKFHFSLVWAKPTTHQYIYINMKSLQTHILIALFNSKNSQSIGFCFVLLLRTTFDLWKTGSMKQLYGERLNKYWFLFSYFKTWESMWIRHRRAHPQNDKPIFSALGPVQCLSAFDSIHEKNRWTKTILKKKTNAFHEKFAHVHNKFLIYWLRLNIIQQIDIHHKCE